MSEPGSAQVDANGTALHVYTLGDPASRPLVMLHGMRDVALSLLPIAERLSQEYRVLLPDLRGHGRSARPGNYALPQYLFDLHCLFTQLLNNPSGSTNAADQADPEPAALFGHSLGGQIVSRFAALFPDLVAAAVIVEGLGPPARAMDAEASLQTEGGRLLETLGIPARSRPLPSVEFAADRLRANNPRLEMSRALSIARQATELDGEGHLHWSFDPRVRSVFLGGAPTEGERYWAAVRCPTLIVSGNLAAEYWRGAIPAGVGWQGEFAQGELETRVALFPDHEHLAFARSGHMVHFDEPDHLADAVGDFLRRRL